MPPILSPQEKELISIYKKAQIRLIKIIATKQARGNITAYQKSLLKQINAELTKLDKKAKAWVDNTVPKWYEKGVNKANADLKKLGVKVTDETFSKLHKQAIELLAANTYGKLNDAHNFVGRRINDTIRQAGIEAIQSKVATGSTVKQAKESIVQNLISEGINGIRDKRGRLISLDAYAQTVARSTTREATNKASINQLTDKGYDLVKMSSHSSPCPICAPLEGRVYSISGTHPDYPPLDRAYTGQYANIHPNCKHVLTPYIAELDSNKEKTKQISNRSFDIDPRSRREKMAYDKAQKENQKLRSDRNQYERYKLAMPQETPATFASFRSLKKRGTGKYKELESQYRGIRREKNGRRNN